MIDPDLCALPNHWLALVWIVWLCFEAWLGRTRAGSTLGLLIRILITVMVTVIQYAWKGRIK